MIDRTDGTLADVLRRRAAGTPDALAFAFLERGEREGARLTFADLHRRALAVMDALLRENLRGRPVLLLYPPGLEFVAAFCGCLYAGAIAVPAPYLLPRRASERIAAIGAQAEPAAVLTLAELAERERGDPRLDALARAAWIATDLIAPRDEWDEADNHGGPAPAGEDLAFLQFTSGSTSAPKGVAVSNANLMANLAMIRRAFGHDARTRFASWLPMFHDMGLVGCVLQPIYLGAPSVLMSPLAFLQSPVRWLRAVSEHRATTSGAPNFAFDLCVRQVRPDQTEGLDLSSWKVAFCGAEPVRPNTLTAFARAFAPAGFRAEALYPCYGLSEATLFVSGGPPGAGLRTISVNGEALAERSQVRVARPSSPAARVLASLGRIGGGQRILIAEPGADRPVSPGQLGEICVSGPHVARGYWRRPAETAQTFGARLDDDGAAWLRTGDLGFVRDGELYVAGRLKDVLIVRGAKHHPQDIEATVAACHPVLAAGAGAAVFVDGVGETGVVVLQEADRRARPADLAEAARAALAAISDGHGLRPDALLLLRPGSLPRTTSGKVQRHLCREAYRSGALLLAGDWTSEPFQV